MNFRRKKEELIYWAQLLNQRGFITARSGNVSCRVENNNILITAHDSYLGYLEEEDILLVDLEGKILEGIREITSEKLLHLSLYKDNPEANVVLHTHSPFSTAFYHYYDKLDVFSFEAQFYLGEIPVIEQKTPTVTEIKDVIQALGKSNIIVLKNHGVVAIGKSFKEAFSLIELLEEQAKVNLFIKGKDKSVATHKKSEKEGQEIQEIQRYKMLSSQHSQRLMQVVNNDKEAQSLGQQYDLTCTLAVKNQDNGQVMCFHYERGKIIKIDNEENAEIVIIGKEDILKRVFNREIDPFVASTQGKVKTKGDFAKMSKWYPVMVRTFKLWEQAPVE